MLRFVASLLGVAAVVACCLFARPEERQAKESAPEPKQIEKYTLPPAKYEKAVEYSRALTRLHFVRAGYSVLVLLVLLRSRAAAHFRWLAERVPRIGIIQAFVFTTLLVIAIEILELPPSVYSHNLNLRFEQSVQGWGSWLWDWAKGLALEAVFGSFVVWILYAIIRRSPQRWWFYFWLATLPIIVFVLFITPLVIEPMFFSFSPLEARHPRLVSELERVAARGGLHIPPSRMFEMNASEKLTSLNAYVTGIGASKRIVVWDNTIRKLSVPQIAFVFAHEMGHYVLNHIPKGIAFAAGVLFVGFFLGKRIAVEGIRRWGLRWGVRDVADYASLPVLLLVASVLSFANEPIANGFSRRIEHQADIYGLEAIHGIVPDSGRVAARSFQILGETGLDDPHPSSFVKFWLYSHPAIPDRMIFAQEYDPWAQGRPPRYIK